MNYWDFQTGIRGITLYINDEENRTTRYENVTLNNLKSGPYTAYYTLLNYTSSNSTFIVIGQSEISTSKTSYDYVEEENNKIPLIINDDSGLKGTINITVKEDDEYKHISTYYNVADGYKISVNSIIETLENMYGTLDSSYTINISYSSIYTYSSSTEFTININDKKSTNIVHNIINNTEKNVQINIIVRESLSQTIIEDAPIEITGDININTTRGIITDNTLTPGNYSIIINFPETDNYKASKTTINFTVEVDKDKIIEELNIPYRNRMIK